MCFVRVETAEGDDEEESEVDVYDDFEDDEGKHGDFLHADYANSCVVDVGYATENC